MRTLRVGLIGDPDPAVTAHRAIPPALALAGDALGVAVEPVWLPTARLTAEAARGLGAFDGLWRVPASPYQNTEGALGAIRFAREQGLPFLGTCGGFQHALIEYARNVAGMADAAHAEVSPDAARPLISRLSCALVEERGEILLQAGSRAREAYGVERVEEGYHCSFGLNPAHEAALADGRLSFTGRDPAGEVRVMELRDHPFFLATLFQPERSALRGEVHPLIRALVAALVPRLEIAVPG
jgi:CTP synthase (UTP-ammonia lyase)